MGHTERRLIAELATLSEAEQSRLLDYAHRMKAARIAQPESARTAEQANRHTALAAELNPFRVALAGYKFDRAEANAR